MARNIRTVRPALAAAALAAGLALAACSSDPVAPQAEEDTTESASEQAEADARAAEAEELLASLDTTDVDVTAEDPAFPTASGDPDAPVTMVVFEDYLCHYCQSMATDSLPELADLVDDGTLRIEHRDIGVLAEQSVTLARAAWAAAQQDGYAAYHESLMSDPLPPEGVTDEALTERAAEAGLDTAQFTEDLAAAGTAQQIDDNGRLAMDISLTGTPTTVVGGHVLVGLQDADTLRLAVEGVLAGGEAASGETA